MKLMTALEWLSCAHFYKKKHCWRSCFMFQFLVGLVVASIILSYFNYGILWTTIQTNLIALYIVAGGLAYGGIFMIYYLVRYGRK